MERQTAKCLFTNTGVFLKCKTRVNDHLSTVSSLPYLLYVWFLLISIAFQEAFGLFLFFQSMQSLPAIWAQNGFSSTNNQSWIHTDAYAVRARENLTALPPCWPIHPCWLLLGWELRSPQTWSLFDNYTKWSSLAKPAFKLFKLNYLNWSKLRCSLHREQFAQQAGNEQFINEIWRTDSNFP